MGSTISQRATTQSQALTLDISNLILTTREQVEVKTIKTRLETIKAQSAQRKAEQAKGPFRLLDLPAELRNRIYSFTFANEKPHTTEFDFARHATPHIARVSRQLRIESLPVFFAKCHFLLAVGTNTLNRGVSPSWIQRAGVLRVKMPVKRAIRRAGQSAIFQQVTLRVCDARLWTFRTSLPDAYVLATISLSVKKGRLEIRVQDGAACPFRTRVEGAKDAAAVLDAALVEPVRIARRLGESGGFKGFGLKDLERIVKPLRFTLGS